MQRTSIVVLSGAGVSAESGLRTFRDGDGLWEEYRIEDVATPEAWQRDPDLVLRFYAMRYEHVLKAGPNAAHAAIARLEERYDVHVITQNIDDLHERAGSTQVMHLHGEITKARSTADHNWVVPINGPYLRMGDRCPLGSQLRPHIVWFGEAVPLIADAARLVARAQILIIVGTSLQVYPAAGLVHEFPAGRPIHLVDPAHVPFRSPWLKHHQQKASAGMPALAAQLLSAVA